MQLRFKYKPGIVYIQYCNVDTEPPTAASSGAEYTAYQKIDTVLQTIQSTASVSSRLWLR